MSSDSSAQNFASPATAETPLAGSALLWIFTRHLASLLLPLSTLAFLVTGPHRWYIAPLFMLPSLFALNLDSNGTTEVRQPQTTTPGWPFDVLVYVLASLQFVIMFKLAQMFSTQGFFSVDMVMVFIIVGSSSGFSIITAHELIHRRSPVQRTLGRLLLATVLQEHFYTEHLRGHHVKVGTPEDPATARFGEDFESFYRRTVPGQIKSAWRLEAKRLGDPEMSLFDKRMVGNRILHGAAMGWGLGLAIYLAFGFVSLIAFVLQAFMASRLLEAVNYFEHWGLRRKTRRVQPTDSWDTHSWFTYYGLTGLSRHADHHREPSRPYQQLEVFEEAPILPTGYIGTVDMVMGRNNDFQRYAVRELQRRALGPFSPETSPEETAEAEETARKILAAPPQTPPNLFAIKAEGTSGLAAYASRLARFAVVMLVITAGMQLESTGELSFAARYGLNAVIIGAFVAMFSIYRKLKERGLNDSLCWSLAMSALVIIGIMSTQVLGA
ncbi:MAG: alkane 1-monooxygenase [Myxococcota bacterium]